VKGNYLIQEPKDSTGSSKLVNMGAGERGEGGLQFLQTEFLLKGGGYDASNATTEKGTNLQKTHKYIHCDADKLSPRKSAHLREGCGHWRAQAFPQEGRVGTKKVMLGDPADTRIWNELF